MNLSCEGNCPIFFSPLYTAVPEFITKDDVLNIAISIQNLKRLLNLLSDDNLYNCSQPIKTLEIKKAVELTDETVIDNRAVKDSKELVQCFSKMFF